MLADRLKVGRAPAIPGPAPTIAILGAGFSGIGLAVRLLQSGVSTFTIFEKAASVGGTWRDNVYPGAACDVPSHLYCYSFEQRHDWSRKFAGQPEILSYLSSVAMKYGVDSHIRFETEIVSAEYVSDEGWDLTAADGARYRFDVLVAATGQLSQPHIPDIPGLESFAGPVFHSARWDHSQSFVNKDVAVIGIGASAIQFVPPLAEASGSLTLYQRSVNYVGPKPDRAFRDWEKWIFTHVPAIDRLYRWSIYARFESRFTLFRQGSRLGAKGAALFRDGLRKEVVANGLPEETVIPDYPLGCRRILISNDWYPTLFRPNVQVVTDAISEVTADAVVTADGIRHPAQAIVFGTGFEATGFVAPLEVTGLDGRKLGDVWADGAAAYLGLTVAGFPNFFLLYGPNTNLGHNSILVMVERQIEYVLRCLGALQARGAVALDVTPAAFSEDIARTQERMKSTVWAASCQSWYKTASGRVTQNWPGFTVSYWRSTLRPRLGDYTFIPARVRAKSRVGS